MKKYILGVIIVIVASLLIIVHVTNAAVIDHPILAWRNSIHYRLHHTGVYRLIGASPRTAHKTKPTPTPKPTLTSTPVAPTPTTPPVATSTSSPPPPSPVATNTPTTSNTSGDPSGVNMPVGDISGWHQVFADNFSTYSVPLGGFSGCSDTTSTCTGLTGTAFNNWWGYPDGWNNIVQDNLSFANYNETKTLSIQNGVMNMHLHQENGTALVSAPLPRIPGSVGSEGGLSYGRYSFRFRGDNIPHYGTAFLLWPDSENWPTDGEIDYPEGELNTGFCAYLHHQGASSGSDQEEFCPSGGVTYNTWHTATIDWLPGNITFYLDGKVLGSSTTNVPNTPMHWVMQTLAYEATDATTNGNIQIDWFTAYTPTSNTTSPPPPPPTLVVTPAPTTTTTSSGGGGHIGKVFLIAEENHNWDEIKGNGSAPYINNTLLPMASHAEQYYNPPSNHPSLPNYLWLESGQCFSYCGTDNNPGSLITGSSLHSQLTLSGKSWHGYMEGVTDNTCPTGDTGNYAVRHDPFVYYSDVNGKSACSNIKSYGDLATDLVNNTVANYNFITPDLCDDGHDSCSPQNDAVLQTDQWLQNNIPTIMNSQAYKNNGLIIITWDEASSDTSDGPIGMIVLSPLAKGNGYSNTIQYTHGSTLRSLEEIFGVSPLLGDANNQTDLSDLFTSFP